MQYRHYHDIFVGFSPRTEQPSFFKGLAMEKDKRYNQK